MPPLLEGHAITVRFGGLVALKSVDFVVSPNEALSVIGPNGAGKTTLFNVLTGRVRPSRGEVLLRGEPIHRLQSHQIAKRGIVRTYQKTEVFGPLPLLTGVHAGVLARQESALLRDVWRSASAGAARAREALATVGLLPKADLPAELLSYGEQRLLEIAQALAADPEVLLLDEPASGMNPQESARIMALIDALRGRGMAIVLVEHNMRVVMNISDRVMVLNYGEKIAEGTADEIRRDPRVIEAYLGHARPTDAPAR